jgi:hypothetical protein
MYMKGNKIRSQRRRGNDFLECWAELLEGGPYVIARRPRIEERGDLPEL